MSEDRHYAIFVTSAARSHLNQFALPVAIAVYERLTGPVAENPHRLGKPLDRPFDDVWTTRRGEYRVFYTIDDEERVVTVLAVAHRRDAYRPCLAVVRLVSRPKRAHCLSSWTLGTTSPIMARGTAGSLTGRGNRCAPTE